MNILAQLFGFFAVISWVLSIQRKEKKKILITQMFATFLYTIQYLLLSVFSAASMNFTSCIRSYVFYKYEESGKEISKKVLFFFVFLVICLGIISWDNYLSLIPIIITLFYTISTWFKDAKWTRIFFLIAAFIWVYYNFKVGAYVAIVGNMLEIVSGVVAFVRFRKNDIKIVTYNDDKLKDNEIDEIVVRAKCLLIDSKDNVLLGFCENSYQFPGGHLEKGEVIEDCLIREVKEETGISLKKDELKELMIINHYTKNYRDSNKNRLNKIYYFLVLTDDEPNLDKTNYVERERLGGFTLEKVNLKDIDKVLEGNVDANKINNLIVMEMLEVINEYRRLYEKL